MIRGRIPYMRREVRAHMVAWNDKITVRLEHEWADGDFTIETRDKFVAHLNRDCEVIAYRMITDLFARRRL